MIFTDIFQGVYVAQHDDWFLIQSPFLKDGERVFGPDSDWTTLACAGLNFALRRGLNISSFCCPDECVHDVISKATGVGYDESSEWQFYMADDATLLLAMKEDFSELAFFEDGVEVDSDFHKAILEAWEIELDPNHVSQGAYVSSAQYNESLVSRLTLEAQVTGNGCFWPPRYNQDLVQDIIHLSQPATIESWTKLSSAGAPSEFSLRAPLLDGITTVLVKFSHGPRGVFLLVDDEEGEPKIGDLVQFMVRRIYAQEGQVRYGLKGSLIQT